MLSSLARPMLAPKAQLSQAVGPAFNDPLSNIVFLGEGVSPREIIEDVKRGTYPTRCLGPFLHEGTHHRCFDGPKLDDRTQIPQGQLSPRTSWLTPIERFFLPLVPASAKAWAVALILIFGGVGYMAYRHSNALIDAKDILNQSVRIEVTNLRGQTVHQILGLQEVSADGRILQQGSIDRWKDGDGRRYVRRLYDSRHRLIETKWRNSDGEDSSRGKQGGKGGIVAHHPLSMSGLWDQDPSSHAFSALAGKETQVHAVEGRL